MFSLKSVKRMLRRPDQYKGKLVGGMSFLLFALPTSAMLLLPPLVRFLGFNATFSMLSGVFASVFLVLGLTLSYAWVAYKSDEASESTAKFILGKTTKTD